MWPCRQGALDSPLRLIPRLEGGKLCSFVRRGSQGSAIRSTEKIGRSCLFPQASCLHFIMCIILDLLQKEKWPFMVRTECGQKLGQADAQLHAETEIIRQEHPHSRQERVWALQTECGGDPCLVAAPRWTPLAKWPIGPCPQQTGTTSPVFHPPSSPTFHQQEGPKDSLRWYEHCLLWEHILLRAHVWPGSCLGSPASPQIIFCS